ncbi:AMP-dependent synthetase/ligase [Haliangium ochraceum]|uniref:AMP-dependent synthetase and ligase n=1 Tax=Haliangium ochraceum (strain DSM 14365 / JCM 11303 / SMP-2) TaxID=502025 RepID=D0LRE2_HALO1|nr:long-chain fatty acid--CoA ligase [Haliangium ochraceum]ACY17170.1 AMP-dependent synthetase and ligase [Haliangium ochraceum DSM 14365]
MRSDLIPARLMQQATQLASAPAYYAKRGDTWQCTTWKSYAAEVRTAARALMALGFEPGSRTGQLCFNRPAWSIIQLGAQAAGGLGVGIYNSCSAEEVRYITAHAELEIVLVDSQAQWHKLRAHRDALPRLRHVVMAPDLTPELAPGDDDPLLMSWEAFLDRAGEVSEETLEQRMAAIQPEHLASLIYTSGTTGQPKGVMLSHQNLAWTASQALQFLETSDGDRALSYLPLAHIAEQMLSIYVPVSIGSAIYYAESLDRVADNLREVKPTVFFGVPRIWEKMHSAVSTRLSQETGVKRHLIDWARGVAARANELANRGQAPGPALALQYRLARHLVLDKLKRALGLNQAHLCACGAAPISLEVLAYFASLDIVIHEVYGQSESSGPTTFNSVGKTKLGTVGTPIMGVDVELADDGEILVRGKNVFAGYYKDAEATAAACADGWLHSGDIGRFDSEGFLRITGRKKEILITSGGKNVAPAGIESALKSHAVISEAVVVGDRRKYLSALVTLDDDEVAVQLGRAASASPRNDSQALRAAVQSAIDEVNQHLARAETIKTFTIIDEPFTAENGLLSPTLKLRRNAVHERYAREIGAMYED